MAKRKKAVEEEDGGDPTVVLLTALGLILLAFFIMLNNMATIDSSKSQKAMNSLIGTFGMLQGYELEKVAILQSELILHRTAREENFRQIITILETSEEESGIEAESMEDGRIIISFTPGLVFPVGGKHISPRYFRTLDRLAQLIQELRYEVRVEGHADGLKPKGKHSNWYLSAARAAAVFRYLTSAAKVDPRLVTAAGFSSTRPGEHSKVEQRRVEIILIPPKDATR